MDNLNLYQNTFAPNSSSSTNFYTQKNFHPRQDSPISPNNDYNNNINQENSNNNNNEEMETVTSKQRTFKNNINEYSPSSNDGRRKNKMIHMIKNSLVQRVKNNVFLKEINNAYNEMGRFTNEGDLASAKMMENELNNLQSEVIMTNLYPVTKFGKSYFNENIYNSTNFSRIKYNTTSKKNKNNKGIYEIDKTTNSIRIRSDNNNIINEENNIEEEEENNENQENNNKFDNNNINKDNLNNNNAENNNIENNNNNINNDNDMNNNEMEEEKDNKDNNENELSNSQNNNQTNEQKEPNPQKNNELNNIQNNEPIQIIIREKTIKENNIHKNKQTIKDRNKNDFENDEDNNYNDYEESNVPYGYENGMYYNQDELEEVYEEYEFDENNRKIPKTSKIAEILEQTRNMVNDETNPINNNQNYYSQIYPYNIPPQNNIYPSTYPQINSWQQNKTNINPNPEEQNYQNSQTFNPSQNKSPENPNWQNKNYPYPNTLYQNNPQNSYPSYPPNSFQPDNQNPEYNPNPENERNIPGPITNLNYPNYPENNNINKYPYNPQYYNLPIKNKPRSKSSKNIKPNQNYQNPYQYGYNLNNEEYPQRPILNFGESLASINNKFRTKPQMRKKSPANIPYSKGSKGKCFACDVECGIGVSGNSPNNYDPYMASLRKPRFDVTFYDAQKFGYYQYSSPSLIQENN